MSLFRSATIACPSCAAPLPIEVADSVSADRRPDLRDAILEGSFQRVVCPSCKAQARLSPSLAYLDAARRLWVLTLPATDRPYWESFEQGAIAIFNDSFNGKVPQRIVELGRTLTVRVAFGWAGLREKLLCQQLGIADADFELLKLLLMRTIASGGLTDSSSLRLLGTNADGVLLIRWVDDAHEAVGEEFQVPRSLLDELAADGAAWKDVRSEITSGPFVDVARMLVEPQLPVAA
jgi:hypothetical protein